VTKGEKETQRPFSKIEGEAESAALTAMANIDETPRTNTKPAQKKGSAKKPSKMWKQERADSLTRNLSGKKRGQENTWEGREGKTRIPI